MRKLKTKLSELITTNWKTTLIGLFIVALATIILFTSKATFAELSPLYIVGVGLLAAKDKLFNSGNKQNFRILIPFLLLFLVSCRTPEQRLNKLLKENPDLQKSIKETITDTIILNKFDTINSISIDTLIKGDTITIEKNNIKVQTFYKDKYIYTTLKLKSDTIFKKIEVEKRVVEYKEITAFAKFIEYLPYILIGLIILIIVLRVVK
ncbi:MAG TPA: hypothetical protein DCS17_02935 [Flavobacterium sp.]|nr:hypothetical protein [Flavobacterium sp.]